MNHFETIALPFCTRGEKRRQVDVSVLRTRAEREKDEPTHLEVEDPDALVGQVRRVAARAHREVDRVGAKLALEERQRRDRAAFADEERIEAPLRADTRRHGGDVGRREVAEPLQGREESQHERRKEEERDRRTQSATWLMSICETRTGSGCGRRDERREDEDGPRACWSNASRTGSRTDKEAFARALGSGRLETSLES